MLTVSIISLIIAVIAAIAALIALSQAKTANDHADEANTLAAQANSVSEQARRDAREAPAEQARRELYKQIHDTFASMADAITDAWDGTNTRPMGPLPDHYPADLRELRRLHDQTPESPMRDDIGRAVWELDSARIAWQDLHMAQDTHELLYHQVMLQENPDQPSRTRENLLHAGTRLQSNRESMLRTKDQVDGTARTLKPALQSLIYKA